MSIEVHNMTELQKEIIEALANDFESIEQIRSILPEHLLDKRLSTELELLVRDGIVKCFVSSFDKMEPVRHPDLSALDNYWFSLTDRGEQMLEALSL